MENTRLTEKNYWEEYYSKSNSNKQSIISICSPFDKYWNILIDSCGYTPENIIEIGGYPGRYLAYLSSKYKLKPYCLDFNSDISKVKESFKTMDVAEFETIQADFEKYKIEKQFDLVISLGFIEHFKNYEEILDKHASLLKENGTLMITVPNMRYVRHWYGLLLDHENLKIHNLKCMKKKVFTDFAKRNNLELITCCYEGGFAYGVHQKLNVIQKVIYKFSRSFFKTINPVIARHPNKFTSSALICIAKKTPSEEK